MFAKTVFAKGLIVATAAAAAVGGIVPAAASAQPWGYQPAGWQDQDRGAYRQDVRYRGYDRRDYRGSRGYRGYRGGRCYDKGNGGLAIGGIAGGLLGNTVAGRGDKTLGTVIGAAAGALAGRAIDKSDGRPC